MPEQEFIPGMAPLDQVAHYNFDPLGKILGFEGAGLLGLMTRDQLHPPMVDDEQIWANGELWYLGAVRHVIEAAQLTEIRPGEKVLDIGCGIGGPARTLVDEFGVRVHAISTSNEQLKTFQEINQTKAQWRKMISVDLHDCQLPYRERDFDVAWSMNMFYHVEVKREMLQATYDALRMGGRILIDDWMLTPRAAKADRALLTKHFLSPHFAIREEIPELLARYGFKLFRFIDLGHVGRLHLQSSFETVFNQKFRPLLIEADPQYGKKTADDFAAAIQLTAQMYREEKLTYFRVVALKA